MDATPTPSLSPGQKLAARRDELDLTQEALARRIGISAVSVGGAERGRNEISKGKRPAWEQALGLAPGTISRMYRDGTDLEIAQQPLHTESVYADLSDPEERSLWAIKTVPEAVRRDLIDVLRASRTQGRQAG